jgi:hypothetical protein
MSSPASQESSPDRRPAHQARLTGAEVNPVLELEETFNARRINIIGNG